MAGIYDPKTMLVLVLGASQFPRSGLKSSEAFFHAAASLREYFISDSGFRLPPDNLIWLFNSIYDPNTLDETISQEISTRIHNLQASDARATNLIVYYVGHGSFDEQKRYYLALKSTRKENQGLSGLRVEALMTTLNNVAGQLQKYIILDACFAGEALYTQSNIDAAVSQALRILPRKGSTSYLCSSSRDVVSEFLQDESNTKFTKALTESLFEGSMGIPAPLLSLDDLLRLIEQKVGEFQGDFPHPEIHTPDQGGGDIAKFGIFPNGPRRVAHEARKLKKIEEEAARQDYQRLQERQEQEEKERLSEKQRLEELAQKEELLRAEQEREQARNKELLQRYDTDAERAFREEAEQARGRDTNRELLGSWLDWKAQQLEIQAGALGQRAKDQDREAATNRYYAGNVWDNMKKEEKSGSDDSARSLRDYWLELIKKAEAEEARAAELRDQAADSRVASVYYLNLGSDSARIDTAALSAKATGESFQETVEKWLEPVLKRAQRERSTTRLLATSWIWIRNIVITIIILLILGFVLRK